MFVLLFIYLCLADKDLDTRYRNMTVSPFSTAENRIGDVMVSVLASSAEDHGFKTRSGITKDFKMGICCFSAKYATLRRKGKDWLAQNQENVSSGIHVYPRTVVSVS